ncbi:MAG: tyrosine-protein phosphatase, partial [Bacteroidales bacterium]|nr:tyrosine-protein phosphatase [Bacteroidales bacterium]
GIASALLLAALGASRETIVADFDATNKVYEKDVKKYSRRVKLWGGKEQEIAVVKAFLGCNTENFVKALDTIDQRYGSLEAYIKGPLNLTDDDIRVLRERYLEDK